MLLSMRVLLLNRFFRDLVEIRRTDCNISTHVQAKQFLIQGDFMRRSGLAVRVVLLIVSIVASSLLVQAQFGASLEGTVTDKSGAVVSGAKVTGTEQATGVSHSTATDASGFYRINELPPGKYTVVVQAGNFKQSSQSDVDVSAERPTPVNVTLDTGSASETVTVTS